MFLNQFFSEIKNRTILITFSLILTFFLCYCNKEILLFIILKPGLYLTNYNLIYIIITNFIEILNAYLKIAFTTTHYAAVFIILLNCLIFASPGLYEKELKKIKFAINIAFLLSLSSLFLFYNFIFPFSLNFFVDYLPFISNLKVNIFLEPKLNEYLDFFFNILFSVLIGFQIIIIFLTYLKFHKNITFIKKKFSKFFYFYFLFLATLLTPPDIVSQIAMFFFYGLFFEIAIMVLIIYDIFLKRQPIKAY